MAVNLLSLNYGDGHQHNTKILIAADAATVKLLYKLLSAGLEKTRFLEKSF